MAKFTRPRNAPSAGQDAFGPERNAHAPGRDEATEQRERVRSAWADFFSKEDSQPSKDAEQPKEAEIPKEAEPPPSSVSPPLQSSNPRKPIMCQMCGKAFAVPAFPAHQKLCLSMWRRHNKTPRNTSSKQDYVFKGAWNNFPLGTSSSSCAISQL